MMNTECDDLIRVLWVEDDPIVTKQYPITAERKHGLDLVHFPCWDDALEALINEFDTWGAIILDAKCKHHKNSPDNAARFLPEALGDIKSICAKKGHQINWYVLSGAGGAETKLINDLISEDRLKWDRDWTERNGKLYYSKTEDEIEILFNRVRYHVTQTERTQIRTQLYREIFEAMNYCKIASKETEYMVDLLLNLHKNIEGKTANQIVWEARAVLESIFRTMIEEWGMLPVEFIKNSKNDQINLTWPYLLLSGVTVNVGNQSFAYKQPVITEVMKYQMQNIIDYPGGYIHTNNPQKAQKTDVKDYQDAVSHSAYLVYGMTMHLCNIILWFSNYVKSHPDPVVNVNNWTVFTTQSIS